MSNENCNVGSVSNSSNLIYSNLAKKIELRKCQEHNIFTICIARLSNKIDATCYKMYNTKDVYIPYPLLLEQFYDNNIGTFCVNSEYSSSKFINIHNKIIKDTIYNYNNRNITIFDILQKQYISNKKMCINDIQSLTLIQELNSINNLSDLSFIQKRLSLDDILFQYKNHHNKCAKRYFRLKIQILINSEELNETVGVCINYLTKIPKEFRKKSCNLNSHNLGYMDDESSCTEEDEWVDDDTTIQEQVLEKNIGEIYPTYENIVYSNYDSNKTKNITNNMLKSKPKTETEVEVDVDIEDGYCSEDGDNNNEDMFN
jgi:hypothetical protein